MGLKIAVSGKGGVGKTTISALIARAMAARGRRVIAVDADPVTNLGVSLGIPEEGMPSPISEMKKLILERTGAQPGTFGGYFKMNPKVDDIPERFGAEGAEGVKLLVMGTVEKGGSGCICPESVLLKNLVQHLLLRKGDTVVMDMEAGVEHLGRATSRAVDVLVIVVDTGSRSHYAARKIRALASDLGVTEVRIVGNRTRDRDEEEGLERALEGFEFLGFMPEEEHIRDADRKSALPFPDLSDAPARLQEIVEKLIEFEH